MLFFIDHSVYWFIFVCIFCLGYLLAHWQRESDSCWVLFTLLLEKITSISGSSSCFLVVSVMLVRIPPQAEGVAGEAQMQQCLNQKCFGLGGYPHPKPNPCLMGSHIRRPALMFPHGDKGASPREEETNPSSKSNQQLLSHHFTVITAKAEEIFSLWWWNEDW